jgi:cytochrome c oxidase accessory protein FixG
MAEPARSAERTRPRAQPIDASSLYASRKKLHVRSIRGVFDNWRWIFVWVTQLVFYGLPWLTWNDRQAVLFHIAERKFYIFGWVFWPQDVIFLAILLIISAFALFFFTAIAGRVWCGYACPQTVYTEIFMWIEEKIEGDHNKRRKLAEAPLDARKVGLRTAKFTAWGLLSLWTGFTFVAYFSPLEELLRSISTLGFGPWETFWILFYGGFTYAFAGVLREQVCLHMCPYARFQGVMFDPDTLVITYDEARGEPRGSRRKGVEPSAVGKGDCIDCKMCVQVCPTGIDIRHGLQYECIGCAACIDACDQVMDKMDYPRGLIRYSTENAMKQHWGMRDILVHVARPRTLIYGALLTVICVAMVVGLMMRDDLRLDIIRDRATLAREVGDGLIENVYRLQLINMVENEREVEIGVSGLEGAHIDGARQVTLPAMASETVTVQVRMPQDAGEPGTHDLFFDVNVVGDAGAAVRERTTFILPR